MGIKTKIAQGILGEKFGDIHQKKKSSFVELFEI